MRTIVDPDVVKAFEQRLREGLAETIRLIEESKEYRAPVELDQQSVGRLLRMDAMQQQAMAQDITRRRQHRKVSIERAVAHPRWRIWLLRRVRRAHRRPPPRNRSDLRDLCALRPLSEVRL